MARMTGGYKERPTIFISSRMNAMGEARQAAFEGAIQAGAVPLLFEAYAAVSEKEMGVVKYVPGLEKHEQRRGARAGERKRERQESSEAYQRERIDELIDRSDYFIGIYGPDAGVGSPFTFGLTPVQYELLRFMVSQRLKLSLRRTGEDLADAMRKVFLPSKANIRPPKINDALRMESRRVNNELRALSSLQKILAGSGGRLSPARRKVAEQLSKLLERSPYARIYRERVRIFEIGARGDGADGVLFPFGYRINLPARPWVNEWRPEGPIKSGPAFIPGVVQLQQEVFDWAKGCDGARPDADEDEGQLTVLVTGTRPRRGYLSSICQNILQTDFNVRRIEVGRERAGHHERAIKLAISSYHGPRDELALRQRADELREALRDALKNLLGSKVEAPRVQCRLARELDYDSIDLNTHLRGGDTYYVLQVFVADIPGMLYHVVTRITAYGGKTYRVIVRSSPFDKGVKYVAWNRKEVSIWARFPGDNRHRASDTVNLSHALCSELRPLLAVYDVRLGRGVFSGDVGM